MTKKRKAREWWLVMNPDFGQGLIYTSRDAAERSMIIKIPKTEMIHMREVLKRRKR